MTTLREWIRRVWGTLRRNRADRDLEEELRVHLDLAAEDERRRTGSAEHAARTAAIRQGGIAQAMEALRDQRGLPFLDSLFQDVRYGLRTLRRSRGFTLVAVVSLALGIGANTAIFSLIDAVLLRSLPVHRPEQLFIMSGGYSYPAYQTVRQRNQFLTELFASNGVGAWNVTIGDGPVERAGVSIVSGNYFSALGVPALVGRTFGAEDDLIPGAHPVAVVSYRYWQRRFARDSAIVGQSIRISGTPFTVVGVTPRKFFGESVGAAPDLWVPLTMQAQIMPGRNWLPDKNTSWLSIFGRLATDTTVARAEAQLTVVGRQIAYKQMGTNPSAEQRQRADTATVTLLPANRGLSRLRAQFSKPLQLLMAVVAFVLLIACANVANLLLARAGARQREIGLRLALGVSRCRLVQQLLVESVILSCLSGLLGLVFAQWGRDVLLRMVSTNGSPVPLQVGLDARMLAFTAAVCAVTSVSFGLAPAWRSTRLDMVSVLRSVHANAGGAGRTAMSRLLVVGQVALSLVLLVGAGLFIRTVVNLRSVDLGFAPERVLLLDVDPTQAGYRGQGYAAVARRLLDRFATVPGVAAVTFSHNGLLQNRDGEMDLRAEDSTEASESQVDRVGPRYFTAIGIPIVAGRDFDDRDASSPPTVIVINEEMARLYFPGGNPIGKRLLVGTPPEAWEIVGVVRIVKQHSPKDGQGRRFYRPMFARSDEPDPVSIRFLVRTAADPAATLALLEAAVRAEDKTLPVICATVPDLLNRTIVQERTVATLSAALGLLGVTLACVGLYGLLAYRVVRQTGEIGVRMALGATRTDVLRMVLREDFAVVFAGVVLGLPVALTASSLTRSLLFGLTPTDRPTLMVATAAMIAIGASAGLLPAWRATRVEPAVVLRHE
jgi:predicted permease